MSDTIKDGTGKGYLALVDSENHLHTAATMEPLITHVSHYNGLSFSWSNLTYDYSAGDTILMVKNTHPTLQLRINKVIVSSDVNTQVIVHRPVVVTPTGTDVIGVILNGSYNITASAIAKANESTNSIANILCSGRILANTCSDIDFSGCLIVDQNQSIAVDFVTDGAACNVTIFGYYKAN